MKVNSLSHRSALQVLISTAWLLLPGACDKQSIGSNQDTDTATTEEEGMAEPEPVDCGEVYCSENPGALDCIARCEDDPSVDGCWFQCEEAGEVDCWGECAFELGDVAPPFSPLGDVGDGTLADSLLVIAQTAEGPFYFALQAERLGDTFQGTIASANPVQGIWFLGESSEPFNASSVDENEVRFSVGGYTFPEGLHPFGDGAVTLDVAFDARIHSEDVLCGTIHIEGAGFAADNVPFAALPSSLVDEEPTFVCE